MPEPSPRDSSAAPEGRRAPRIYHLIYAIVVYLALLAVWERFAGSFTVAGRGLATAGGVYEDATGNDNLPAVLAQMPPAKGPRVLVLGSSQIATVKNGEPNQSVPYQLAKALEQRGAPCEVVDFSAGGQQIMESMFVLLGCGEKVRPDVVLVGTALFGMQSTSLRESLLEAFPARVMTQRIRSHLPSDIPPRIADAVLSFAANEKASATEERKGQTIQQQLDERIGDFLCRRLRMAENRRVMFNKLVDSPVRKDLVACIQRNFRGVKVARTYPISSAYEPSLAALGVMQDFCRERGIRVLVADLPYDSTVRPIPYTDETQARVMADLQAGADRYGSTLLELSHALEHEHFGLYLDGSSDGLHFKAEGHRLIADAIADALIPLVLAPRAAPPRTSTRPQPPGE